MSHRVRRIASATAIALAAATAPLVFTAPAQADQNECVEILTNEDYEGDEFEAACESKLEDCLVALLEEEVEPELAVKACVAASEDEDEEPSQPDDGQTTPQG